MADSGRSCIEIDGDFYRFVLKRTNFADGGTYIIKASNCHGTQKAYCTVRVRPLPFSPSPFSCSRPSRLSQVKESASSEWDVRDAESVVHELSDRRDRRPNKGENARNRRPDRSSPFRDSLGIGGDSHGAPAKRGAAQMKEPSSVFYGALFQCDGPAAAAGGRARCERDRATSASLLPLAPSRLGTRFFGSR